MPLLTLLPKASVMRCIFIVPLIAWFIYCYFANVIGGTLLDTRCSPGNLATLANIMPFSAGVCEDYVTSQHSAMSIGSLMESTAPTASHVENIADPDTQLLGTNVAGLFEDRLSTLRQFYNSLETLGGPQSTLAVMRQLIQKTEGVRDEFANFDDGCSKVAKDSMTVGLSAKKMLRALESAHSAKSCSETQTELQHHAAKVNGLQQTGVKLYDMASNLLKSLQSMHEVEKVLTSLRIEQTKMQSEICSTLPDDFVERQRPMLSVSPADIHQNLTARRSEVGAICHDLQTSLDHISEIIASDSDATNRLMLLVEGIRDNSLHAIAFGLPRFESSSVF